MSNNLKSIKTAYRSNTRIREHGGRLNQKQYNNPKCYQKLTTRLEFREKSINLFIIPICLMYI